MKREPVLVASVCQKMELIRTVIRIIWDTSAHFIEIDFNTGVGMVNFRGEQKKIKFIFPEDGVLVIELVSSLKLVALFDYSKNDIKVAHKESISAKIVYPGRLSFDDVRGYNYLEQQTADRMSKFLELMK